MCWILVAVATFSAGVQKRYVIDWCYTPAECTASQAWLQGQQQGQVVWHCEAQS